MSSRKPAKKIQKDSLLPRVKAKKPKLRGAETALAGSGLAREKRGNVRSTKSPRSARISQGTGRANAPAAPTAPQTSHAPKRKRPPILVTSVAVVTAIVGTAIGGPSEAAAAKRASFREGNIDPVAQLALPEANVYIPVPAKFLTFEPGRDISALLGQKQNHEKHKGKLINGIKLLGKNTYRVSLENSWYVDISLKSILDQITFRVMAPSQKAGERPKELDSFSMDYSRYDFANPILYLRADPNNIFIGLINEATSQFLQIRMEKTNLDPQATYIRAYDESHVESIPQQAFALLSNYPIPLWTNSESSRVLKAVFPSGARALGEAVAEYDAGGHRKDLSALIDDFIDINSDVNDIFVAELKARTKDLPSQERKKILQEIEPYLLALVLRPFAIWADDPSTITRLDELIASSDLNEATLWNFAGETGLFREYKEMAVELRAELSSK